MDITTEILNNIINYGNEERETEMSNEATETANVNNTNEGRTNMENKATEIIDSISDVVYDLTTHFRHNATRYGCREFVKTAYENKGNLRRIFRNHTKWDEEKQAIIMKGDYYRPIDADVVYYFFSRMYDLIYDKVDDKGRHDYRYFRDIIRGNLGQFLEDDVVDEINNIFPELRFHHGAKLSRVVDRVMKQVYKADEIHSIELVNARDENNNVIIENGEFVLRERDFRPYFREFSKFADAVNPIKEKRWIVISINPIDILTMSFFVKGASCHTIDKQNMRNRSEAYHGMYCGGCLSYALDSVSAIVYALKDDYDPETAEPVYWNGHPYKGFYTQDKLLRQMIHYEGNVMIQGRLYPQENDGGTDLYKTFREIEERVIAECIGKPNLWKYIRGPIENRGHCYTAEGAHNYEDYFYYDTTGTCIIKGDDGEFRGNEEPMEIGHVGIDINTGDQIGWDDTYHGVLTETDVCCCYNCGEPLDEDDAIMVDGHYYCRDCVTWCEYHQEYEARSEDGFTYVDGYGTVCDDGVDEMISEGLLYRCENCGELSRYDGAYGPEDGYIDDDGNWYCSEYCYDRAGYVWSDHNGCLIYEDDAVMVNGEWCKKDELVSCSECGQLVYAEDMVLNNDGIKVCCECANRETNAINAQAEA